MLKGTSDRVGPVIEAESQSNETDEVKSKVSDNYTVPSRKRAHYGMSTHPPLWAQLYDFLLRSNVYLNMRPCVAALENAAQMASL